MKKSAKACAIALSLALAALFTACSETPATQTGGADITETETTLAESPPKTDEKPEIETSAEMTTTAATTTTTAATTSPETSASTEAVPDETTSTAIPETAVPDMEKAEVSNPVSENPPQKTPAINSAVSLHELHKEKDKPTELTVLTPSYTEEVNSGWFYPIEYSGTEYYCTCFCDFIADKNKNVSILEKFDDKLNGIMSKLDDLEYAGTTEKAELGAGRFGEADVYKYGEKLILIFNNPMYGNENFLLHSLDFREKFLSIPAEENSRIGTDADKLEDALSERNINNDPSVFLSALLYEEREEDKKTATAADSTTETAEPSELKVKYFDGDSLYGSGGARAPVEYKGVIYEWPFITGYYTIDKDKNVTSDLLDFDKWELDPNDKLDAMMLNFKELEYLGSATGCDVYQYDEDNLLFVANSEFLQMYSFDFREKYFGMSFEESAKIGNDHETLKEYLAENGIEYDPTLFYEVLLYEKTVRDENGVVVTETEEAATVPALSWETADE